MRLALFAAILGMVGLGAGLFVHTVRLADHAKMLSEQVDHTKDAYHDLIQENKRLKQNHESRVNTLNAQLNSLMSVDDDCATHALIWDAN